MRTSIVAASGVFLLLLTSAYSVSAIVRLTITIPQTSYSAGEIVVAYVATYDEANMPKGNQLVTVSWLLPNQTVIRTVSGLTDTSGSIVFEWQVPATAKKGLYRVVAEAEESRVTAYFEVIGGVDQEYMVTVIVHGPSVPIWVNGQVRGNANSTFQLALGLHTIELPSEYAGMFFQRWEQNNQTSPKLSLNVTGSVVIVAWYGPSGIQSGLYEAIPLIVGFAAFCYALVAVIVVLFWLYREGYF